MTVDVQVKGDSSRRLLALRSSTQEIASKCLESTASVKTHILLDFRQHCQRTNLKGTMVQVSEKDDLWPNFLHHDDYAYSKRKTGNENAGKLGMLGFCECKRKWRKKKVDLVKLTGKKKPLKEYNNQSRPNTIYICLWLGIFHCYCPNLNVTPFPSINTNICCPTERSLLRKKSSSSTIIITITTTIIIIITFLHQE